MPHNLSQQHKLQQGQQHDLQQGQHHELQQLQQQCIARIPILIMAKCSIVIEINGPTANTCYKSDILTKFLIKFDQTQVSTIRKSCDNFRPIWKCVVKSEREQTSAYAGQHSTHIHNNMEQNWIKLFVRSQNVGETKICAEFFIGPIAILLPSNYICAEK